MDLKPTAFLDGLKFFGLAWEFKNSSQHFLWKNWRRTACR